MKVCILTHTFPRFPKDVAAPFMDGVAKGIASAGNKVWVLTPYSPSFPKKPTRKEYKVVTYKYAPVDSWHRLGYSETLTNDMSLKSFVFLLSPFMFLSCIISLFLLVKREKIDIINAHWILPNGFLAAVVAFITGVPVVSTLPGSDVYMVQKNPAFRLVGAFSALISKAVTSNSGQLLEDLHRLTNVSKSKLSTIIYGVDAQAFKPDKSQNKKIRKELQIPAKDIVVLSVGRLVAKKGFVYLIKAAAKLLSKRKNITFVIIGEGDQRNELETLAKKLGINENCRFPGWVDYKNLIHYYNLADIFILPSIRDEKGNLDDQSVSVVEAMACARPIVTSDFPGYRLVVNDNENGFLVKEKDADGIAKALSKLVASESLREKMGKKSRDLVLKNFTWGAIGKQYTKLFQKIVQPNYSQSVPIILDESSRLDKARQILKILKTHRGSLNKLRCLDVGCSSGVITQFLAQEFKDTVGIDVDNDAIETAKKKYETKNLRFEVMPGEKLTFPTGSFDIVVANQIYEFVDNPDKTFGEIFRVLKKGGICFMGARNKYALMEAQYKLPLLSILPQSVASFIVRATGRGQSFVGKYKSHDELKDLVSKFEVHDYTTKIMREPRKYGYLSLEKYKNLAKLLPLQIMKPILPNYIWILEKK